MLHRSTFRAIWAGLIVALVIVLGSAADEPLSPAEREKLREQAKKLMLQRDQRYQQGKIAEAADLGRTLVQIHERLYTQDRNKDGLLELARSLNNLGVLLRAKGAYPEAVSCYEKALASYERLYPKEMYENGHDDLATTLNNLGVVLKVMGEYDRALKYYQTALAMRECLCTSPRGDAGLANSLTNMGGFFDSLGEYGKAWPYHERALAMNEHLYPPEKYKNGKAELAHSLNNVGYIHSAMGEYGIALPYYDKALAMRKRLYPPGEYPDGHPDLAYSLNNLGFVLQVMGEYDKALPYFQQALEMNERLYPPQKFKSGHRHLALSLNNVGYTLKMMGEPAKALPYYERALAMRQRLYPPDRFESGHAELAHSLHNLGSLFHSRGEYNEALPYYEKALAMNERLYPPDKYKDGHPHLALSHHSLGSLLHSMGESDKALSILKRGLEMYARKSQREASLAPETQVLALLSYPRTRDVYLSAVLDVPEESASTAYDQVWPTKGVLLELMTQRHQAALVAASNSPRAQEVWPRLIEVRRRLNRLAVDTEGRQDLRQEQLRTLTGELEKHERELLPLLPTLERQHRLADVRPKHLHEKLPPATAFIDLVRHGQGEKGQPLLGHYQAFVLAPGQEVRRVDLGCAKPIDEAVASWRRSIDALEHSNAPLQLKKLVWDKLAAQLPPGTKVIYLCPEGDLARLPWAALPGRQPDTILLEEVAVAVVPSGKWLLEQLLYPQKPDDSSTLVAAGNIDYGPAPTGKKAEYPPLAETERELKRVLEAFGVSDETGLRGQQATPQTLQGRLATARYAHLATHAYYDEKGVAAERARVNKDLEHWKLGDERRVRVGQHPLGFVGLALAGANDPRTAADGGILTGLGIVDVPLENLRLCVLSACETGLGELTQDEGVSGLQRAFHVAGCPNVVGSLWKVNDAATVALMTVFYHELRVNKQAPLEALRRAQLTIYRHPKRIQDLAGERGRPAKEVAARLGPDAAPTKPGEPPQRTPTKLWAAFILSGVGK